MATNTVTIGNHQELHIGQFKMDRSGMLSGSIQRHVKQAFDEVSLELLSPSAAPATVKIPCVTATRDYDAKNGMGIYTYSYEGLIADPDESQTTFELDITMEEVSIEAHPNIKKIEAKYGTFDPRLKRFPKEVPADFEAPGLVGAREDGKVSLPNPVAGTDSYLVFGATFRKIYVRKAIPAHVLRGIGAIMSSPPGLAAFPLPPAAKKRKWLKLAPKITKRGNCVQLEENAIMSGRKGIVKEIYGAAQLGEEDGGEGGASGLSSGGLSTGSL